MINKRIKHVSLPDQNRYEQVKPVHRLVCRLLSQFFDKKNEPRSTFLVGNIKMVVELLDLIELENNVCCKIWKIKNFYFVNADYDPHDLETIDISIGSIVVCFNWFQPSGFIDYITLGRRLVDVKLIPLWEGRCLVGDIYWELASRFILDARLQNHIEGKSRVIYSGFSLGGCVAQLVALANRNPDVDSTPLVITYGSPIIGCEETRDLCLAYFHPDSISYVLHDRTLSFVPAAATARPYLCTARTASICPYDPAPLLNCYIPDFAVCNAFTVLLSTKMGQCRPFMSYDASHWRVLAEDGIIKYPSYMDLAYNVFMYKGIFNEVVNKAFRKYHNLGCYYSSMCIE